MLQAVIDDRQPHAAIGRQPHQVGAALRVVAHAQVHPREVPIRRPVQPDAARTPGPHHAVPPAQYRPVAALAQLRLTSEQRQPAIAVEPVYAMRTGNQETITIHGSIEQVQAFQRLPVKLVMRGEAGPVRP
ncbi:hypothetical protein D3C71_1187680 [compost metagenome]